jgi:Ca2+-transporting ATPase
MDWHTLPALEVLRLLSVTKERGLSTDQIEQRKKQYGNNELVEERQTSLLQKFFNQFKDITIIILIVAAFFSFMIALLEQDSKEFVEPVLILVIVVLNAIMGVSQEQKAQKALEALKKLSSPHIHVLRDNKEIVIESKDIVPGDLFYFESGTLIPCDGRIVESHSLLVDESPLTGESVPVEKDVEASCEQKAPLGDRINMVFAGCAVVRGRGMAVATQIGMHTEMGTIASLLNSTKQTKTPLQQTLSSLGKILAISAIVTVIVIFIIGIINSIPIKEMMMIAISLAVSAIPEGLPAIVTIVLSLGVQRMSKKNAIIRHLPAVETLGRASIICTDKTGTLTQNNMSVTTLYLEGQKSSSMLSRSSGDATNLLLSYATLCSDATAEMKEGKLSSIGDPTEVALVVASLQKGITKDSLLERYPRIGEIPFDSNRKRMSTIHNDEGRTLVIVKGAVDQLIPLCSDGDSEKVLEINKEMGSNALRVLAIAYRYLDDNEKDWSVEKVEHSLHFLGLLGMIDPPRKEAFEAVAMCRSAGIRPIMITGDHIVTARAIAKELQILQPGDEVMSGEQLSSLSDEQLKQKVTSISVYARVSPEDKIRIVQAWQNEGMVVAMTGDGVNDAPALKSADIGCAMGITGTDVAKSASDMTLSDDNFATIVEAIKEGRIMYDNIKKTVFFLIGTNIGELITVFSAMLIWHMSPFISLQLLWINLVTDSFPSIALGMEKGEKDVMERLPKKKGESLFAHHGAIKVIAMGIMFALLTLVAFSLGNSITGNIRGGRTLAFITLALSQVIHAFNMRSSNSLFSIGVFSNRALNRASLLSIMLIAIVVAIPAIATSFGMMIVSIPLYLLSVALSFVSVVVMEVSKFIVRKRS